MNVDYVRPVKTRQVRDDFAAHVARGSVLPGLDYACESGERVNAAGRGRVVLADGNPNQVRGRNVIVQHPDGRRTHYLHLSTVTVRNGERVRQGDKLGKSGNSGTTSTGAHLHFTIQDKSGKCIDPEKFLRKEKAERVAEGVSAPMPTHLP